MPSTDNFVAFYSKSADASLQCFSNFAPLSVAVDGVEYPTGEHAFHASKLLFAAEMCKQGAVGNTDTPCGKQRIGDLLERAKLFAHPSALKTAADAKRAGGKSKKHGFALLPYELSGWHNKATRAQHEICSYKLNHYTQVQQALRVTGRKLLLHQDNRAKKDTPWGGRVDPAKKDKKNTEPLTMEDVIGCNGLGRIWMKLRSKLLKEEGKRENETSADADGPPNKKFKTG